MKRTDQSTGELFLSQYQETAARDGTLNFLINTIEILRTTLILDYKKTIAEIRTGKSLSIINIYYLSSIVITSLSLSHSRGKYIYKLKFMETRDSALHKHSSKMIVLSTSGAWCYNEEGTTPRWELCDIPICGTQ